MVSFKIKVNKEIGAVEIDTSAYTALIADLVKGEIRNRRVTPRRTGTMENNVRVQKVKGQGANIIYPQKYAIYVWDMETRLGKKINWTTYYNPNAQEMWALPVLRDTARMDYYARFAATKLKFRFKDNKIGVIVRD